MSSEQTELDSSHREPCKQGNDEHSLSSTSQSEDEKPARQSHSYEPGVGAEHAAPL